MRYAIVLALLALASCASVVNGGDRYGMGDKVAWIAGQTGMDAPYYLPELHTVPLVTFCEKYGMEPSLCAESGDVTVEAIYDHETGSILANEEIDLDSIYGQSLLVHELVHFLQFENAVPKRCVGDYEQLAYYTQADWLEAQGVKDPWKVMRIDPFTVVAVSYCAP